MTGDDPPLAVDQHRVGEAELPDAAGDLLDLLLRVGARVALVGHELLGVVPFDGETLPAEVDVCRAVIDFYGIRTAAGAVLSAAQPVSRQVLLGWLLRAANSAPQSLMALDLFLRRPQQDYGLIAEEQTA